MEIKYLSLKNLADVVALQKVVINYLDKKELLETLSVKELENVLSQPYAVGIYVDNVLIAFRTFLIPHLDERGHLADDVGVNRDASIYSELSLVHPEYRGLGIQTKMGKLLIESVRRDNTFRYVLATVAPDNIPSLKDKFKLGFQIYNTSYKYGHKLRHIMMRDLEDLENLENDSENNEISVSLKDTEWMLKYGHAYVGFGMENGEIHYYKK